MKVLTENILPELLERKRDTDIKIWSAGCATGEEPYSIAMALMESALPDSANVSIYATDISKEALKKATEGIYSKGSMRSIDKTILNKYFTQKDGRYYLHDTVKQRVCFDTINLIEPFFPREADHVDIIICKNVLIYFRTETVKTIIQKFYNLLTPGGYLFVGHSESLWQISDDFDLEEVSGVFVYCKEKKNRAEPAKKCLQHREKAVNRMVVYQGMPSPLKRKAGWQDNLATQTVRGKVVPQEIDLEHKRNLSEWIKKGVHPPDGNYEEVLEYIEEALQKEPKNVDAHLLAGKIYANIGLYDKALKKGLDALEVNDLSADAYLMLGSIYYTIGEKEKAISSFKKTIYLDNNSVLSHYYLGNLYKEAHLIEQAIKEYKNVIHIFETNTERKEWLAGEVFTVKQLKEICARNAEILASNQQGG